MTTEKTRVYHVQVDTSPALTRPERLVRATSKAAAERHVLRSCIAETRVATQDDLLTLYPETPIEVAGMEADADEPEGVDEVVG